MHTKLFIFLLILGPNLHGLIGRKTGSVPDFDYTDMNKNKGEF